MRGRLVFGAGVLLVLIAIGAWLWTPDKSRTELESKYLASPADYLDVAGLRLHVRDTGRRDAPAIVFLHGLASSLHTWEPWADSLSAHYRVVRYDLPGFGLTGADPTGDYSDERGMQVLAALMAKLGIERAHLVGNSLGGRLAWRFAAEYPSRVDRLVLISPDGFESPGYEYGKAPTVTRLTRLMEYVLPKSMLRANLAAAYANPAQLKSTDVTRYHDLLLAPGVRSAMLARMEQTVLQPPEPWLARIITPTLIVWGQSDALIPVSNAADYLKSLSSAEFVSLPELGHVPHEEQPRVSLPPLEAFLKK